MLSVEFWDGLCYNNELSYINAIILCAALDGSQKGMEIIMKRESFRSRLGFILISAGCAIGIGNVWRFPYIAGYYGGGAFVLFYLLFLLAVGVPVLTMEFSIGRASRQSAALAYQKLEKPGQKWHWHAPFAVAGNYLLMMYYTTVAGWMLSYFFKYLSGSINTQNATAQYSTQLFQEVLGQAGPMAFWTLLIVVIGFFICSMGLQRGVERITKWMMVALLVLIVALAVHSISLPGGMEGLKYYLVPDLDRMRQVGVLNTIGAAMNQSFFTLSLGIGAMLIFGSYISRDHALLGESLQVAILDTFVAVVSGLIIFPACFSFQVSPDSGPNLIFITLPAVFGNMNGGRLWGALFFLFMTFASLSTVIAVFENILACCMDKWGWSRKKACLINLVVIAIASMPCVLGFNLWSAFHPLGADSTILDLEDFLVSNLLLPIGSLIYLLFCVSRWGWGFQNYLSEVNTGAGLKMPKWLRVYLTYLLPILVFVLILQSIL